MNKVMMIGNMVLIAIGTSLSASGATMCSGESASVSLDLATGVRTAAGSEAIRYSTAWVDGAVSDVTAVVTVNGEGLKVNGEWIIPFGIYDLIIRDGQKYLRLKE